MKSEWSMRSARRAHQRSRSVASPTETLHALPFPARILRGSYREAVNCRLFGNTITRCNSDPHPNKKKSPRLSDEPGDAGCLGQCYAL
jgi:hypothetical protein